MANTDQIRTGSSRSFNISDKKLSAGNSSGDLSALSVPPDEEISIFFPKVESLIKSAPAEIWSYHEEHNKVRIKKAEYFNDCDPYVRDRYFKTEFEGKFLYITFSPDHLWVDAPSDLRFPPGTDLTSVANRDSKSDFDYRTVISENGPDTPTEIVAQSAAARDLYWSLYNKVLRDSPMTIQRANYIG